ncbi:hypothetical protein AMAG_02255 [Allomyces macrogynus ATCC 38327]|uniref:Uncharacterized protein n=1 Tax=Allomyces macrogynus (strain ATCC 38327) TaxID=578462 RepID=A0A0L0S248_ALLM3|nr:hypothetical protein AMAG_02255 [Allomyces macrogynus ATCC 38327]|eukprot:KNE56449.1 hypothetical protein AMAG_02255 [Allomyces macrogynus ATCC 38327]
MPRPSAADNDLRNLLKDAHVLETIIREYDRKLEHEVAARTRAQTQANSTHDRRAQREAARQIEFANKRVEILATELVKFLKRHAELKDQIFQAQLGQAGNAAPVAPATPPLPAEMPRALPPVPMSPRARPPPLHPTPLRKSSVQMTTAPIQQQQLPPPPMSPTRLASIDRAREHEVEELRRQLAELNGKVETLGLRNAELEHQLRRAAQTTPPMSPTSSHAPSVTITIGKLEELQNRVLTLTQQKSELEEQLKRQHPAESSPSTKAASLQHSKGDGPTLLDVDFGSSFDLFGPGPGLGLNIPSSASAPPTQPLPATPSRPSTGSRSLPALPPRSPSPKLSTSTIDTAPIPELEKYFAAFPKASANKLLDQVRLLFAASTPDTVNRDVDAVFIDQIWRLEAHVFDLDYQIGECLKLATQLQQLQSRLDPAATAPGGPDAEHSQDFPALQELFVHLLFVTSGVKEKLRLPEAQPKRPRDTMILDLLKDVQQGTAPERRSMAVAGNSKRHSVFQKLAELDAVKERDEQLAQQVAEMEQRHAQRTRELDRLLQTQRRLEDSLAATTVQLLEARELHAKAEKRAVVAERSVNELTAHVKATEEALATAEAHVSELEVRDHESAVALQTMVPTTKLDALEHELAERNADLAAAHAQTNDTEAKVAQLAEFAKEQKREYDAMIAKMHEQIQDLVDDDAHRVETLEAELRDLRAALDAKIADVQRANAALQEHEAQVAELNHVREESSTAAVVAAESQQQLEVARAEIEDLKEAVAAAEEQAMGLSAKLMDKQVALDAANAEIKKLQEMLAASQARAQVLSDKIAAQQVQLELVEARARDLSDNVDQLTTSLDAKMATIATLTAEIDEAHEYRLEAEERVVQLKERIEQLDKQVAAKDEEVQQLTQERDVMRESLTGELNTKDQELAHVAEQLGQATQDKEALKAQIAQLADHARTKDQELARVADQMVQAVQDKQLLQAQTEQLTNQARTQQALVNDLQASVAQRASLVAELTDEIALLKAELATITAAKDELAAQLEQERATIHARNAQIVDLQYSAAAKDATLAEITVEMEGLQTTNAELAQQAQANRATMADLARTVRSDKEQIGQLQLQLQEASEKLARSEAVGQEPSGVRDVPARDLHHDRVELAALELQITDLTKALAAAQNQVAEALAAAAAATAGATSPVRPAVVSVAVQSDGDDVLMTNLHTFGTLLRSARPTPQAADRDLGAAVSRDLVDYCSDATVDGQLPSMADALRVLVAERDSMAQQLGQAKSSIGYLQVVVDQLQCDLASVADYEYKHRRVLELEAALARHEEQLVIPSRPIVTDALISSRSMSDLEPVQRADSALDVSHDRDDAVIAHLRAQLEHARLEVDVLRNQPARHDVFASPISLAPPAALAEVDEPAPRHSASVPNGAALQSIQREVESLRDQVAATADYWYQCGRVMALQAQVHDLQASLAQAGAIAPTSTRDVERVDEAVIMADNRSLRTPPAQLAAPDAACDAHAHAECQAKLAVAERSIDELLTRLAATANAEYEHGALVKLLEDRTLDSSRQELAECQDQLKAANATVDRLLSQLALTADDEYEHGVLIRLLEERAVPKSSKDRALTVESCAGTTTAGHGSRALSDCRAELAAARMQVDVLLTRVAATVNAEYEHGLLVQLQERFATELNAELDLAECRADLDAERARVESLLTQTAATANAEHEHGQLVQLQDRVAAMRHELDACREQLHEAHDRLAAVHSELATANHVHAEQAELLAISNRELDAQRALLHDAQDRINVLMAQIAESAAHYDAAPPAGAAAANSVDYPALVTDLEAQVASLRGEFESMSKARAQLETELATILEKNMNLVMELSMYQ